MHRLEAIGWTSEWAVAMVALDPGGVLTPARVAEEHKGGYRLLWRGGELWAEVSGRMRYVACGPIHHVLPRRTCLVRKASERPTRGQLLAANVDTVLAMCSANLDFSPRRIERILTLARDGAPGVWSC